MSEPAPFDPQRIVQVLAAHDVQYILVGALAARLQGFPRLTADADLTPARNDQNMEKLASALQELGARVFTESVPEGLVFDCSAKALANAVLWNLVTSAGRIDLVFEPAGTGGYEDLRRTAIRFEVFGAQLDAASLADIIRSKEAADRPQDRHDVAVMREMLRREAEQHS